MSLVTDKSNLARLSSQETPFFLWDLDVFKARIQRVIDVFSCVPRFRLYYAIKANSSNMLVKTACNSGINVDVCSVNELRVALENGYTANRISGCLFAPSETELHEFIHAGCDIDIDSLEDLTLWCKIADSQNKIGLRINPDVQAGFHEHCASGVWDSKFGIASSDIPNALQIAKTHKKIIEGLHIHVGSSAYDPAPYLQAVELILQAVNKYHIEPRYINFGGGWGIPFDTQDDQNSLERFPLENFAHEISCLLKKYAINERTEIRAEPGEYLAGPSGFLVCSVRRVIERRNGARSKRLVVVDGGTYLYPGPALYGSDNFVVLLNREEKKIEKQVLAGRSMMAGDLFGPERLMPLLHEGDVVAIGCAGSYSQVKASRFNLLPEAKEQHIS